VQLMAAAQREVDEGRTPACQLALAINGEPIALEGFGAANDSTRFSAMSCTKEVVAATMLALISERSLTVEVPVVDLFPEFGTNGKHGVSFVAPQPISRGTHPVAGFDTRVLVARSAQQGALGRHGKHSAISESEPAQRNPRPARSPRPALPQRDPSKCGCSSRIADRLGTDTNMSTNRG
jgi:hypothetical protein